MSSDLDHAQTPVTPASSTSSIATPQTVQNTPVSSSRSGTVKNSGDENCIGNHESNSKSRKDIWRQGRRVTKEDFARFMRFASGGKEVLLILHILLIKAYLIKTFVYFFKSRLMTKVLICFSVY
jgi:hypothetical protein